MEQDNKKKKGLNFWAVYGIVTAALLLIVGLLLNRLYTFLDAYEATRPVHEADKVVASVFLPENEDTLKELLANEITQDTESKEELLDIFYQQIEGKELSYGRYFGHYSDEKPQYIVSAGDTQVAYFSLKETTKYNNTYSFKLWEVDSVTLLMQPKYSYAVTIPETMTLYINGEEIAKTAATGHKDSDCKVGYAEYSGAGFYVQPEIKVVDRAGQEVKLVCDEATGAYYYMIHYAYAPSDTVVSFGGTALTEDEVMESDIEPDIDFFMIREVIKKYSEYQSLADVITYPVFTRYYVDLYAEEEGNTWTNRLGTESPVTYDADTRTFAAAVASDDTEKEQLVQTVTDFLKTYSLFCSGDKKITDIRKYFPDNSEYYEKISHLNNYWFQAHSDVSFQNIEVKEFVGYSENYAYVHIYMEQRMKLTKTGEYLNYPIDLPVWMVTIGDSWYVGGMDFDNFLSGYNTESN